MNLQKTNLFVIALLTAASLGWSTTASADTAEEIFRECNEELFATFYDCEDQMTALTTDAVNRIGYMLSIDRFDKAEQYAKRCIGELINQYNETQVRINEIHITCDTLLTAAGAPPEMLAHFDVRVDTLQQMLKQQLGNSIDAILNELIGAD